MRQRGNGIALTALRNIRSSQTRRQSTWRQVIAEKDGSVNAFVCTTPEPTLSVKGALEGVTVAVKDNISTKDMKTTCSSAMLKDYTPPLDATVVQLLRQSGADIIGKTNCDEFGMGSLNIHSIHGPVINPHQAISTTSQGATSFADRERRSAGGSSGGSAAAVAAGMCNATLATDTGGSTRLPAAYCGVVGLKPSYGLISRWGVVSFADSLDCVGIIGDSVKTVSSVFHVISKYDPKDPTSASNQKRSLAKAAAHERISTIFPTHSSSRSSLNKLRIGVPSEYFPSELRPSILSPLRRTLHSLKERGATLVSVDMPATRYALSAYYVLASAEAGSCLARFDGVRFGTYTPPPAGSDLSKTASIYAHSRSAGFGEEVRKRMLLGAYALTADAYDNYFLQAQRVRELVRRDFERVFGIADYRFALHDNGDDDVHEHENNREEKEESLVDVLIHPSAIRTAPRLKTGGVDEEGDEAGGLDTYVQDVLTVPASLAGVPALNVPVRSDTLGGGDGWPVGVSVVGQWGCDELVMEVGKAVVDSDS